MVVHLLFSVFCKRSALYSNSRIQITEYRVQKEQERRCAHEAALMDYGEEQLVPVGCLVRHG